MGKSNSALLEVKDLKKYFPIKKGFFNKSLDYVKAVDGVSFKLEKGETLGLVGESGCGKSTAGRTVLRLIEPTEGTINFDGEDIASLNKSQLRKKRKDMQIIFQDPYSSLNPRLTAGDIIGRAIDVNHIAKGPEREKRINDLLDVVGLGARAYNRYPNEFSGGQRQRIGIARALAVEPQFIMCDEPISALDVSIQAQIVNLLIKLQKEMGLTYLFISHGLSMVKHISDRVGVMYLGSLVELASNEELYEKPLHPYTQALISAIPVPDPNFEEERQRIKLEGEVPSPINPPVGCKFVKRCKHAMDICSKETPKIKEVEKDHFVACHLYKDK